VAFGLANAQAAISTRFPIPSLSQSIPGEFLCGAAVDSSGDLYVGTFGEVKIFDSGGAELTSFSSSSACEVAVDSGGNLYVEEFLGKVTKYKPSSFPPTAGTTYSPDASIGESSPGAEDGNGVLDSGAAGGVAVDPASGSVYVSHIAAGGGIRSYQPNGTLINGTIGTGVAGAKYSGVDVYGPTGEIYAWDNTAKEIYIFDPAVSLTVPAKKIDGSTTPDGGMDGGGGLLNIAVDQSDGNVFAFDEAHLLVNEFKPSGALVGQILKSFNGEPFATAEPSSLAVDNSGGANNGTLYVTSLGKVSAYGPLPTTGFELEVKKAGAGTGTVTSSPAAISCGVLCKAKFGVDEAVTLVAVPNGNDKFAGWHGTDAEAAGCDETGATLTCEVMLTANKKVTATFTAPPAVSGAAATHITASSAWLEAQVNPEGEATTYQFEYLTEAAFVANGESFSGPELPIQVPVSPAAIGSGLTNIAVAEQINGLSAETAYRYRLLASNSTGTSEEVSRSFRTFSSSNAVEPCGNNALRTGLSAVLPDCRAYEQATPVNKNGGSVQALIATAKASVNGDAVSFESAAGIPGGTGAQEFATYLASRNGNSWSTQGLLPSANIAQGARVLGWTPDFAQVFDSATKVDVGRALLSRSSADGSMATIVPSQNPFPSYSLAGVSADGSDVLFGADKPLPLPSGSPAPAAGRLNLYAWNSENPGIIRLAGILPNGSVPPGGSLAGQLGGAGYTRDMRAVATDGSVYFTAGGQIYLRENPAMPETAEKDGEGNCKPDSILACTIHVSASQKTNGTGPNHHDATGTQPATFMAASADGSKAFLASSEKLTDDATTGLEPAAPAIARADISGTSSNLNFLPAQAAGITVSGEHIYWASPTEGTIGRAKLNGSSGATEIEDAFVSKANLCEGFPTETCRPEDVAVDSEHLYWTNNAGEEHAGEGTIGRAELGVGGAENIESAFIPGVAASTVIGYKPRGIAVDNSHVYWVNSGFDSGDGNGFVARANLDGTNAEAKFIPAASGDVAVNADKIYYSRSNGSADFIRSINLDGVSEESDVISVEGTNSKPPSLALDGSHLYWSNPGQNAIGRSDLSGTPASQEQSFLGGAARPEGIAVDASEIFWSANQGVEPNPGNDLYRFDAGAPDGGRLTDLAPDSRSSDTCPGTSTYCGAQVQGVLGTSADGSYVYFAANGVPDNVTSVSNANGESAKTGSCDGPFDSASGECNLYLWHDNNTPSGASTFIARLNVSGGANGDVANWVPTTDVFGGATRESQKTSRVTSDGGTLLFRSRRKLTSYDNEGKSELYRYQVGDSGPICISCNPTGAPGQGASLGSIQPPVLGAGGPDVLSRNLSADGNMIFFETNDKLVAADTNGDSSCAPWGSALQEHNTRTCQDVYEWEAMGTGSCKSGAQNGGCIYLLSTGKGSEPSFFADASASGKDVFIFTASQLVGQDKDELIDAYDVRVNGGLASQNEQGEEPCNGEACRGLPVPSPSTQSPGSAGFAGPGNQKPVRPHKKKHHKKRHRGKAGKIHHHQSAKTTGGAGR